MPYIQRDPVSGAITGLFGMRQSFATEFLSDTNPNVINFRVEKQLSAFGQIDQDYKQQIQSKITAGTVKLTDLSAAVQAALK